MGRYAYVKNTVVHVVHEDLRLVIIELQTMVNFVKTSQIFTLDFPPAVVLESKHKQEVASLPLYVPHHDEQWFAPGADILMRKFLITASQMTMGQKMPNEEVK